METEAVHGWHPAKAAASKRQCWVGVADVSDSHSLLICTIFTQVLKNSADSGAGCDARRGRCTKDVPFLQP